jgi:hypothetical protein
LASKFFILILSSTIKKQRQAVEICLYNWARSEPCIVSIHIYYIRAIKPSPFIDLVIILANHPLA